MMTFDIMMKFDIEKIKRLYGGNLTEEELYEAINEAVDEYGYNSIYHPLEEFEKIYEYLNSNYDKIHQIYPDTQYDCDYYDPPTLENEFDDWTEFELNTRGDGFW